jgi:hypothetical protein
MIKELNIFIDNKPGRSKAVTGILAEKNINIKAISIQSRDDFGVMRLIVDKPDEALLEISNNGFACALKDILAIQVEDKPGSLDKILGLFSDNKININDFFAFVIDPGKYAVLCIEVEKKEEVKKMLSENNIKLFVDKDLYG